MRVIYRPVWDGIQQALKEIFEDGWPADKVIQHALKVGKRWGSHDRRLFAECVYDLVRWRRRLEYAVEDASSAASVAAWCGLHDVQLDRLIVAPALNLERVQSRWRDPNLPRAVRASVPDWMDEWGHSALGEKWDQVLENLNASAPVFLRANRLKTDATALLKRLEEKGLKARARGADAVELVERSNVFLLPEFKQGWFEVQDLHSQAVVPELQVEPGLRVIDACAGAGGKTLHMASLMGNKGKIIALDVSDKKLAQLKLRARRAGAGCIEMRSIESGKTVKRLSESADRVLLDVPCSGMGVIRRNPDSKWKLKAEEIPDLTALQASLLREYSKMCKPGGILVYATCSVMPEENGEQVRAFLEGNAEWKLERERTLWPEAGGADGFYFARLRRG